MNKIYRFLLISVVMGLTFVAIAPPAYAAPEDEPTGLTDMRLWIHPEYDIPPELAAYDDPLLLVMLRGRITGAEASVADPVTVRFLVPSAASMYSAGYLDQEGYYHRGGFADGASGSYPEREDSDIAGWDEITFAIPTNRFVVEYYDPSIIGETDKTVAYEFRFLYPISELDVAIVETDKTSNLTVLPAGTPGSDNFLSDRPAYWYSFSDLSVTADSPLQFAISYISAGGGSTLLVVGIVCIVLVVVAVGFFLLRKAKQKSLAARHPVRISKKKAKRQGFCRQCGKQLDKPSPHCPYCGAKQK